MTSSAPAPPDVLTPRRQRRQQSWLRLLTQGSRWLPWAEALALTQGTYLAAQHDLVALVAEGKLRYAEVEVMPRTRGFAVQVVVPEESP